MKDIEWKTSTRSRIHLGFSAMVFFFCVCFSVFLPAMALAAAPAAPSGLVAKPGSPGQIQLNWIDNSGNELGFVIQRNSGSGFVQVKDVPAGTVSFLDTNLTASKIYSYRVAAYNTRRNRRLYSAYSNIAQATAPAPVTTPTPAPAPAPGAITVSNLVATSDATNAYYSFNFTGAPKYLELFLDSDNNPATGYPINGIGADYLVETTSSINSILYRYAGSGGTWTWSQIKHAVYTQASTSLKVTVARADIGNPQSLKVLAQLDWLASATSPIVSQTLTSGPVSPPPTPTPAPTPATGYVPYNRTYFGLNRGYDFDGATPFVNPNTGESDMSEMFFNAQFLNYDRITDSGASPWITKVNDGGAPATRFQVNPTDAQIWSWRSQASSFPFQLYKHYRWEYEFKLDPSWNLNMGSTGYGIIWQTQSAHKPGQVNSALNLSVYNNQLRFHLMYPKTAMNASSWPTSVTWTNDDYVPTSFQDRTITTGRYYRVRMEFFADDRPPQFGGQGYMNIWLDDVLWIQHRGPTMHPDQLDNGDHRADFGWYNWGGQPTSTRTIYFKTMRGSVKP